MVIDRRTFQQLAIVALIAASSLTAQTTSGAVSSEGSSRALSQAPDQWPQRAWISLGLGLGTWPYGSLAGVASGWYSRGPIAIGGRAGGAGQWIGEQRGDQAFLIGARTRANHGFLLGSLGVAHVSSSRTCDGPCGSGFIRPSASAVAYSVEAHSNFDVAGLGLTMFGVLGPASNRYNAFALTFNAG